MSVWFPGFNSCGCSLAIFFPLVPRLVLVLALSPTLYLWALSTRIGALNTEWMIERGGVEAFEQLAITRSRLLYAAWLAMCNA